MLIHVVNNLYFKMYVALVRISRCRRALSLSLATRAESTLGRPLQLWPAHARTHHDAPCAESGAASPSLPTGTWSLC